MKKAIQLALILGVTAAAQSAVAAEKGWYVGIGAGQNKTSDWLSEDDMVYLLDDFASQTGVTSFNGTVSASSDDKDTGWKIFSGYQFTPAIGVEVAYIDLGAATAESSATGTFNFASGPGSLYMKVKAESSAFVVDAVGKLPVASWLDLFAKFGLYSAQIDITVTGGFAGITGFGGPSVGEATASEKDSSTGLHLALGADFNVAQHVAIRAEWERLSKIEFQDADFDITGLSLSAIYRF